MGTPIPRPEASRAHVIRAWRWLRALSGEINTLGMGDRAAALTYYSVLSLTPAFMVVVSLLGLVGGASALLDQLTEFAPGPARDMIEGILADLRGIDTSSGIAFFVVGLSTAVWSASRYIDAFVRSSRVIRPGFSERSGVRKLVVRLTTTVLMFALLFVIAILIVVSGPLTERLARLLGLSGGASRIWELAKWPIILLAMVVVVALLYSAAGRSAHGERMRPLSVGGTVAILLWVAFSAGFSFYVTRFSSYSRVYGSLAGVIVFLIWMWMSNLALLLGVLVEARRERRRATVVR